MGMEDVTSLRRLLTGRWEIIRRTDLAAVGLVGLVATVGLVTGFAVYLFEWAVEHLFAFGYERLPEMLHGNGLPGWVTFVIFPVFLGLAVAAVKALVPARDRHHAIPLVIISLFKRDGRLNPVSTALKTLGSILTLGAGGSLGREGPVVLLGGGIGSGLGQLLRLPPAWTTTLVAAGAGAAIATAFKAPITGALFAMEIVLIHFSARTFALVALACVMAAEVSKLFGAAPPFPIPAYEIQSAWEVPLYMGLGLLIAPLARLYVKVLYGAEDLGQRIRPIPQWLKPALSGALFGLVALLVPRTLGGGYETISSVLLAEVPLLTVLMLLGAKLLTISLTAGGGWPGGVFTPALFLGSMAGGAYGLALSHLLPGIVTQPGAYAVVGMAAMIAGATHAPLTALTLIFEVTLDYRIALPAMVACGIAAVFSQRLSPYSVDTLHLPMHGILLPWQVHDLREVHVSEAMTREVHTVRTGMHLKEVIAVMQRYRHGGFPVLDGDGRLVGMVTLRDVREVPLQHRLETPVERVMSRNVVTVTPDQTLADAALLMARKGIGRLPVVDPEDPARMVGLITRTDIVKAYPCEVPPPAPMREVYVER